jgi:uncharacterized protein (TIGR03437 family)
MPELQPVIEPGGIVNGATFAPGPVAPGSIVSIFGTDLAPSNYTAASVPLSQFPPFGISAFFTFQPGYFYVSPSQWNIQIPSLAPGTYQLAIGSSSIVSFTVVPVAPYIFVWNGNRTVAQNADYSLNQRGNPASAGSAIMVYLTGQGAVDPPVPDRFAAQAQPLSKIVATVTAAIDGHPADAPFAGLAPGLVGVGQVNVSIPIGLPAGEHTLAITIGGVKANEVQISTK